MTDRELSELYLANCEADGYPATNGLHAIARAARREASGEFMAAINMAMSFLRAERPDDAYNVLHAAWDARMDTAQERGGEQR